MTLRQLGCMGLLDQLRPLRKRRGLTQAELAELADLDRTTISKVEKGATGLTIDTAERIFGLLGTDLMAVDRVTGLPEGDAEARRLVSDLVDVLPHLPPALVEDLADRIQLWRSKYRVRDVNSM